MITAYADKSFTFIMKTPPATVLIKKAAKIEKGSPKPHTDKVGKLTREQAEEIAKTKMPDLTAADLDAAVRTIAGSARSMGIESRSAVIMADKNSGFQAHEDVRGKVDRTRAYPVDDALKLVKETATAKFDESVDVAVNLGIDAKKSDQTVRGSVVLPQGTGKTVRVAVFAQGDKAQAGESRRRRHRRLRRPRREDQGRQDGFRRRDRHAGCDARRRPARPDPRARAA